MSEAEQSGAIITFYSFKGGVGRSMAVANTGRLLARLPHTVRPVLLIDWDLEAPGLHHYFEIDRKGGGLIDYFHALRTKIESDQAVQAALSGPKPGAVLNEILPLADYIRETEEPRLSLMPAGGFSADYAHSVATFSWSRFFYDCPYAISAFRELLTQQYSWVLVDSRTGITDISGMCTALLPDKLVALFVPNSQNLKPLLEVVEAAVEYRRLSGDPRRLLVFPVASRFDPNDLIGFQGSLLDFQREFQSLFQRLYALEACDLSQYFGETILLYIAHYSYGEPNAVGTENPNYAGSLQRAYRNICGWLIGDEPPWGGPS